MTLKFPAIYISAATGKKVYVARKQDYRQNMHLPVVEAPVAKVEEEESAQPVVAAPTEELDERAKFEEMKVARAWMKAESKDEYNRLKAIYG